MPHYTEIYVAAQNKDEILLQQALQHASINVLGCIPEVSPYKARVISSPVCQLAIEGNQDAVNFLLAKGASRGEAIYGYAIRGDQGQVDALLAQDKGAHRDHAIEGYALGKHIPQAEALAKDLDTGHQWLLLGYAKGGHFEQVNALLAGGLDPKWAIHGYAISGHMDQIDPLLEVGSIPDGLTVNYAMGGHVAKVNALLEQDSGLITEAIHGYAAVGNVAEVTYLLARGGKPIFAIFGFALGGRVDQVKALLAEGCDPAKLAKIAEGYAVGGHVNQVNDLLKQGLAPTDVIYGYALSGNTAQVEALLKRCQNFLQLDQAGYQAVYGYAHGGHRAGVNSLLERKVPQGKEAALKGYVAGGHTIYLDELAGVRLFEGIDNWLKELRKLGDHFMVAYANKLRARALKVFSGSDDEEPDEELDSEPPQLLESDEAKDAPEEKPGLVEEKPDRAALGVITDKNDSFRIGQAYAHDYAASNLHLLPNQEEFDWSAFTKDVQATYERHFQTEQNTQGSKVVTRVLYCDGAFANSDFKNKTIEAVAKAYLAAVKKYLKHFDRIDILALNPEVAAIFKNKLRSLSEELCTQAETSLREWITESFQDSETQRKFEKVITQVRQRSEANLEDLQLKREILSKTTRLLQNNLSGDDYLDYAKTTVQESFGWKLVAAAMIAAGLALGASSALVATATLGGGTGLALALGAGSIALTTSGLSLFKQKGSNKETCLVMEEAAKRLAPGSKGTCLVM